MSAQALLQLARSLHALKSLPRTGWGARGVVGAETVGAHSHGVVTWALWLARRSPQPLDLGRILAMAALHDLPEAGTGDLMPTQKALLFGPDPQRQKAAMAEAEGRFWQRLDESFEGFRCLWEEYRQAATPEAQIVKQADALDCVLQAILYGQMQRAALAEFSHLIPRASAGDPELTSWLESLWRESFPTQP